MNLYQLKLLMKIIEINKLKYIYPGDIWDLYIKCIEHDIESLYVNYYDNIRENKLPRFMWIIYHTFREGESEYNI